MLCFIIVIVNRWCITEVHLTMINSPYFFDHKHSRSSMHILIERLCRSRLIRRVKRRLLYGFLVLIYIPTYYSLCRISLLHIGSVSQPSNLVFLCIGPPKSVGSPRRLRSSMLGHQVDDFLCENFHENFNSLVSHVTREIWYFPSNPSLYASQLFWH